MFFLVIDPTETLPIKLPLFNSINIGQKSLTDVNNERKDVFLPTASSLLS
jgi:hypothetical protein